METVLLYAGNEERERDTNRDRVVAWCRSMKGGWPFLCKELLREGDFRKSTCGRGTLGERNIVWYEHHKWTDRKPQSALLFVKSIIATLPQGDGCGFGRPLRSSPTHVGRILAHARAGQRRQLQCGTGVSELSKLCTVPSLSETRTVEAHSQRASQPSDKRPTRIPVPH
jgi:hypothetical protein